MKKFFYYLSVISLMSVVVLDFIGIQLNTVPLEPFVWVIPVASGVALYVLLFAPIEEERTKKRNIKEE